MAGDQRRRVKLVGVRLTRDEMTILSLAAMKHGQTVASFLRASGLAAANGNGKAR